VVTRLTAGGTVPRVELRTATNRHANPAARLTNWCSHSICPYGHFGDRRHVQALQDAGEAGQSREAVLPLRRDLRRLRPAAAVQHRHGPAVLLEGTAARTRVAGEQAAAHHRGSVGQTDQPAKAAAPAGRRVNPHPFTLSEIPHVQAS
jgi:hypothetical protein